jgi:hypothetical protein
MNNTNKFPSIETMCKYGLSGFKGTNPIALFECYKNVPEKDLSEAMENGTLNNLIMKNPSIQGDPYFIEVMKQGGVQIPPKDYFECETCGFYSVTHTCKCFKDINQSYTK